VDPSLWQDLLLFCRSSGKEPVFLLSEVATQDPLTAVLKQSIAFREVDEAELSLQLLDRACQGGLETGWLHDNRARALIALGRLDEALAIWDILRQHDEDPALQQYAWTALNSLRWPQALLSALAAAELALASIELARWLDAMEADAHFGVRELVQVLERSPLALHRLVPLLERYLQRRKLESALEILHCLKQRCAPASIDRLIRLSTNVFFVAGCRAAAGAIELIAATRSGLWCQGRMDDLGFQRQDGSNNESWFVILRLPIGETLDQVWVNGCLVNWSIQNLQGWPYLDCVETILSLCRASQVPLRSLPQLLQSSVGPALLELSKPLKDLSSWRGCIRVSQCFGRPAPQAEITVVVPLYGRWEYIRGHVAAFSMDPWFQAGRVRVVYVCDDPRLHLFHRWCAMHLSHEDLDITVISLRRNMGFGMACNIGVHMAETPLVCLMNSDVMPIDPGWLDPLYQRIQAYPEQLLSPLLVYDTGLIQHAGMITDVQDNGCRGFPANIHLFKGLSVEQLEQSNSHLVPCQCESLSGAMLLFSRDCFLKIGGFHPAFGRGDFEDLELSQRWKQQQGQLWLVPQSRLMHLERQSMPSGVDEAEAWRLQANAWLAMELCPDLVS